ncbi:hypothetical protein METP2_02947 [Methanosarcinales archaeon]|nr:hypothetical protein METP2_02947 [Methanosarcinales archaeon]
MISTTVGVYSVNRKIFNLFTKKMTKKVRNKRRKSTESLTISELISFHISVIINHINIVFPYLKKRRSMQLRNSMKNEYNLGIYSFL